ncbi:MAG: hypothetical protein HY051_03925 [Candidatus Aenigmarchaeota archaeon]|nr:hypothetical protein [Candidatus Aenigmarchaeota archaeon]
MKKGQFFVIGALVLILFMFYATYNSRFEVAKPVDYTKDLFSNVKSEVLRSASLAYYQGPYSSSVESNVTYFLDFVRNATQSQRSEVLAIIFLPVFSDYNVSVVNFLTSPIDINVTVGGVERNTTSLTDKSSVRFVFNTVSHNSTVNVTYVRNGVKTSNVFNLTARKLNTYVDIKLFSSKVTWTDKVVG